MKKYLKILEKTKLFKGLSFLEIESMMKCLNARVQIYKKGEYVYQSGDIVKNIMILVEGSLHLQNIDYWGNRSIVNYIGIGEMFGEAYAAVGMGAIHNDIIAIEDSAVMFFDVNKIIGTCASACTFHTKTLMNFIQGISEKNISLVTKLGFLSKRTIRDKLLAYLSEQAIKFNSSSFEIPFNRQELADFLSVDRSALSKELSKMRDEGILNFQKNKFRLFTH